MAKTVHSIPPEVKVSPPPLLLGWSIPGFAEAFGGIHRATVYEEIRGGRLRAVKLGRRTIITYEDGKAYIDALPQMGAATT